MNVQITGITGFVGKNLSHYLTSNNFGVSGLSLRDKLWENHFNSHVDALVHLAGMAHDTSNAINKDQYFAINRDLTILLFEKFISSSITDFFYFSSVKAVADTVEGVLLEDVEAKPLTAYGESKYEAEKYILGRTLPPGKRVFIIRPCMIHGPGNKGNLNLLYDIVEKGIPWPLAKFKNQRSYLSIDNLSFLIAAVLTNKNVASGVYNFADDEAISTNDLYSLIARVLERKPSLWYLSTSLIHNLVKFGDLFRLPLNSERLKKLTESYVVSNRKIKKALNIDTLPLSVYQGLEITLKDLKKNNK